MNDRFKFRCWNKKTKKMYEVLNLIGINSIGINTGLMSQVKAYDPIND